MKQKFAIFIILCFLPTVVFSACSQQESIAVEREEVVVETPSLRESQESTEVNITEAAKEQRRKPVVDFFRQYYERKAASDTANNYFHMSLEALANIASSTSGVVVDTEEICIEVVGAVFSGNTAEIVLRVTAKKLESVLNNDAASYSSHYQFGDESAMLMIASLGGNCDHLSHQYTYCDTDESLEPNQFLLHYWLITPKPLDMENLSIPLQGLGRISARGMVELFSEGNWQVDIAVDPLADNSNRIYPNAEICIGEHPFTVSDILLSPLACTVHLACQENEDYINENQDIINQLVFDEMKSCTLLLEDGSKLGSEQHFVAYGRAGRAEVSIMLHFNSPMNVMDIASVELFGTEFALK